MQMRHCLRMETTEDCAFYEDQLRTERKRRCMDDVVPPRAGEPEPEPERGAMEPANFGGAGAGAGAFLNISAEPEPELEPQKFY